MAENQTVSQSSSSGFDSALQTSHARRVDLQPVEEFLRENPPLANAQEHVQQPPKKKQKARITPDEDVIAAEREALAAMGEDINWVGKLQEYRSANPCPFPPHSPIEVIYTETTIIHNTLPRFKTTVSITEKPSPFDGSISFRNKKDAKRYAAKLAVDWLIANQYMPADGSVKFPKANSSPAQISDPASGVGENGARNGRGTASFASQVPALCYHLGFPPPTYKEEKLTNNLYNMYADFGGDLRLGGKVGEVMGVFGRASAKEMCAEGVLRRLREVERERLGMIGDGDGDGSGSGSGSGKVSGNRYEKGEGEIEVEKFFDC